MDWRKHMKRNVLNWLTKGDNSMRLDENFLMLFGNPYLFQEHNFRTLFSRVSSAGVFYRGVFQGQALSFCHPLFGAPSIDALMLEDDRMIEDFVERGFQAVDLETACLYSLGAHLGMQVASLHIVSDNPAQMIRESTMRPSLASK